MSVLTVKVAALIVAAAIIGLNFYLVFDNNPDNSLSEIVRGSCVRIPAIPWIYGFLGGHWFHPGLSPPLGFWTGFFIILLITLAVQVVASQLYPQGISYQAITTTFVAGIVAGAVLWPT